MRSGNVLCVPHVAGMPHCAAGSTPGMPGAGMSCARGDCAAWALAWRRGEGELPGRPLPLCSHGGERGAPSVPGAPRRPRAPRVAPSLVCALPSGCVSPPPVRRERVRVLAYPVSFSPPRSDVGGRVDWIGWPGAGEARGHPSMEMHGYAPLWMHLRSNARSRYDPARTGGGPPADPITSGRYESPRVTVIDQSPLGLLVMVSRRSDRTRIVVSTLLTPSRAHAGGAL